MSAFNRMLGRVREQLAELGESIVGNQAQRVLDEDIRDADGHLRELRASLAAVQARRVTAQERLDAAIASILQREAQALASLEAGKPALARDVAAAIVLLEERRDDEQAFLAQLDEQAMQLRLLIEQGENGLRRLQHRLDVLRTAETVQRAQETIAGRQHDASALPQTAIESLLRARQQQPAAAIAPDEGAASADDSDLDARLEAAGIDERDARAQLVLDRISQRLTDVHHTDARATDATASTGASAGRRPRAGSSSRSPR
jgi:phage shock protein A